ncbi:hypothetical protein XENTR_v10016570 [Xenopus tropicalis]|nr:hypothetical protein XENTR_v10016570 [Xenopus tropicalis]
MTSVQSCWIMVAAIENTVKRRQNIVQLQAFAPGIGKKNLPILNSHSLKLRKTKPKIIIINKKNVCVCVYIYIYIYTHIYPDDDPIWIETR